MQLKHDESDVRVQQAVAAEQPPITESVKLRLLKLRVSKLETHYKLAVEECERYDHSDARWTLILHYYFK